MLKKNKRLAIITALLLIMHTFSTYAQLRISSPYSRYGLGEIQSSRYSKLMSMGGAGYAINDSLSLNLSNPASLAFFSKGSFMTEVGLASTFTNIRTSSQSQQFNNNTSLGYLAFGFPVMRSWGTSISLSPYSNIGYKLLINDSLENIGEVSHTYEGSGGLNKFCLGNGIKILPNLSLGMNISFLFGTINQNRSVYFDEQSNIFSTRIKNTTVIGDFNFEAGLQYQKEFKNSYYMGVGLYYQLPYGMNANKTFVAERFTITSSGTESIKDTVEYTDSETGIIYLPESYGIGLVFGNKKSWLTTIDFNSQCWSKYRYFGEKDSLTAATHAGIGIQYKPEEKSSQNYFRKMVYRIGFRYDKTSLMLSGNHIEEYAFSMGMGFPLKSMMGKNTYSLNFALEVGKRGKTDNDLIQENFIRACIGISIKESWFNRRKLD